MIRLKNVIGRLKEFKKKNVCPNRKNWALKLANVLWAYQTTCNILIRMSPCRLIFGKAHHFHVELEH